MIGRVLRELQGVKSPGIGLLRESPLHAALKLGYAGPDDAFEVPVGGFVIDVVRSDGELIEIQTGSFWPLRPKLEQLLDYHRIRVVHPVPAERQVVRLDADGQVLSSRRSPLKGRFLDVFEHLVSFPTLLSHPNFTLEVLLCKEEHWRASEPGRTRRGRRSDPGQRRLVEVLDRLEWTRPEDTLQLLPVEDSFTTRSLAQALKCPLALARRFVYCLRAMELITQVEKRRNAPVYARVG